MAYGESIGHVMDSIHHVTRCGRAVLRAPVGGCRLTGFSSIPSRRIIVISVCPQICCVACKESVSWVSFLSLSWSVNLRKALSSFLKCPTCKSTSSRIPSLVLALVLSIFC